MRGKLNTNMIVETAAKIADENGLDAVTLTHVATKLNIKKQSLYNHIDNLFHLKCELVILANSHLKQYLMHAAVGKSRDEAVLEVAKAYRQFAHTFPGQYQAIISLAWECKDNENFRAATRELMDILFRVLSQYQLRGEYLTHAVRGLRSIMHGFASLEASGWFRQPIDKEDSYLLLVQTFIYGIEAIEKE